MNPFESGSRKVIPAVLIYVFRTLGDGAREVLMLHRNAADRPGDYHAGKWNGLGGKLELGEPPLEASKRELKEESGLDLPLDSFRALGVLSFPNFKAHKGEDWNCTVFTAELPKALHEAKLQGPEGDLHWVKAADLKSLNLWTGDRHFIDYVAVQKPFIGTIWYEGQVASRHWVQPLS